MSNSVKLAKVESLLKELLPEAMSELADEELRGLSVVDVRCSKGKYDAKVFLDKGILDEKEQREAIKRLKKASGLLKSHCLNATGWYRCPDFTFVFDDETEKSMRMEQLFKQVEKELDANRK